MVAATIKFAVSILWAFAVGGSVVLSLCFTVIINKSSPSEGYNGFYVGTVQILIQVFLLLPQSFCKADRCQRLPEKWPLLGGLVSIASFIAIPAGGYLGAQAVLLSQLAGMLSGAVFLDVWSSKLRLSDVKQWVGFAVILFGFVLDELSAGGSRGQGHSTTQYLLYTVGVYVVGIGYTFQASCNGTLAKPLGSAVRATLVTNLLCLCVSAPVWVYLQEVVDVKPTLAVQADWPLWIGAGAFGAFYNYSFAVLPQIIGYTATYVVVLAGKLVFSTVTDAVGFTGVRVPFSYLRGFAVALVLTGTLLFSWPTPAPASVTAQEDACDQVASISGALTSDGPDDQQVANQ